MILIIMLVQCAQLEELMAYNSNVSDETFWDLILEAESERIFELILNACSDEV